MHWARLRIDATACRRETLVFRVGEPGGALRTITRAGIEEADLLVEGLDLPAAQTRRLPCVPGACQVIDTVLTLGAAPRRLPPCPSVPGATWPTPAPSPGC